MPGTPSYRHACCCFYCVKTRTSPVRLVRSTSSCLLYCKGHAPSSFFFFALCATAAQPFLRPKALRLVLLLQGQQQAKAAAPSRANCSGKEKRLQEGVTSMFPELVKPSCASFAMARTSP